MTNKLQQPHLPSCLMGNNCNCPVGYGDNRASSEAQEWTVTPIHSKHSGHTDVIIACVLDTGISEYRFNDDGGSVYAALKDVTDAHNTELAAERDAFASKHPTSFVRIEIVKKLLDEVRKPYDELLYAVERKFEGKTRHEIALRYIREAEHRDDSALAQAKEGK